MNRFLLGKESQDVSDRALKLSFLLFVLILLLFLVGISSVSAAHIDKQEESLKSALSRNIVHCYALEGAYPPSLDYMEEHYGLTYDKKLFFVDYQIFAPNLYPEVTIIRRSSPIRVPVLNKAFPAREGY